MFFISLDIPLKSTPQEIELTIEKQRQILIIGTSEMAMKFCTIDKNSIIDALETEALEIAPVIMYKALIIGAKVFIAPHRAPI